MERVSDRGLVAGVGTHLGGIYTLKMELKMELLADGCDEDRLQFTWKGMNYD